MSDRPKHPKGWPSVTQILAAHGAYQMYENANIDSQAAMQRGRHVDMACNVLAAYGSLDDEWMTRHPECEGYIEAYKQFLREHKVKLIDCQFEVEHCLLQYVGHPDQLVELDDDPFCLLSLKTGAMPLWNALQEAAYVMAMRTMPAYQYRGRITRTALQLKADGKYTFRRFDDPFDEDNFRLLVMAYYVRRKYFEV